MCCRSRLLSHESTGILEDKSIFGKRERGGGGQREKGRSGIIEISSSRYRTFDLLF